MDHYPSELRMPPRPQVFLTTPSCTPASTVQAVLRSLSTLDSTSETAVTLQYKAANFAFPVKKGFSVAVDTAEAAAAAAVSKNPEEDGDGLARKRHHDGRPVKSYRPVGLLKKNFFRKHFHDIPAVAAVVAEFRPGAAGSEWEELRRDLESRLEGVKRAMASRDGRVLLLLVGKCAGEDGVADQRPLASAQEALDNDAETQERVALLRKVDGLEQRNVTVLAISDVLQIQSTFRKFFNTLRSEAFGYYLRAERRVKAYEKSASRGGLPPDVNGVLSARYFTKVAFFYDFQNNVEKLTRYYQSAYDACVNDCPRTEKWLWKVKALAEVLTLKLCFVYLREGNMEEAERQFKRNLRNFHRPQDVGFAPWKHEEWLMRQNTCFAEMLGARSGPQSKIFTYTYAGAMACVRRHDAYLKAKEQFMKSHLARRVSFGESSGLQRLEIPMPDVPRGFEEEESVHFGEEVCLVATDEDDPLDLMNSPIPTSASSRRLGQGVSPKLVEVKDGLVREWLFHRNLSFESAHPHAHSARDLLQRAIKLCSEKHRRTVGQLKFFCGRQLLLDEQYEQAVAEIRSGPSTFGVDGFELLDAKALILLLKGSLLAGLADQVLDACVSLCSFRLLKAKAVSRKQRQAAATVVTSMFAGRGELLTEDLLQNIEEGLRIGPGFLQNLSQVSPALQRVLFTGRNLVLFQFASRFEMERTETGNEVKMTLRVINRFPNVLYAKSLRLFFSTPFVGATIEDNSSSPEERIAVNLRTVDDDVLAGVRSQRRRNPAVHIRADERADGGALDQLFDANLLFEPEGIRTFDLSLHIPEINEVLGGFYLKSLSFVFEVAGRGAGLGLFNIESTPIDRPLDEGERRYMHGMFTPVRRIMDEEHCGARELNPMRLTGYPVIQIIEPEPLATLAPLVDEMEREHASFSTIRRDAENGDALEIRPLVGCPYRVQFRVESNADQVLEPLVTALIGPSASKGKAPLLWTMETEDNTMRLRSCQTAPASSSSVPKTVLENLPGLDGEIDAVCIVDPLPMRDLMMEEQEDMELLVCLPDERERKLCIMVSYLKTPKQRVTATMTVKLRARTAIKAEILLSPGTGMLCSMEDDDVDAYAASEQVDLKATISSMSGISVAVHKVLLEPVDLGVRAQVLFPLDNNEMVPEQAIGIARSPLIMNPEDELQVGTTLQLRPAPGLLLGGPLNMGHLRVLWSLKEHASEQTELYESIEWASNLNAIATGIDFGPTSGKTLTSSAAAAAANSGTALLSMLCELYLPVPSIRVFHAPFDAVFHVPASVRVHEPFDATWIIRNCTTRPHVLRVTHEVDSADTFIFSGRSVYHLVVGPSETVKLPMELIPLHPGQLTLPACSIFSVHHQHELLREGLQKLVFVRP